MTIGIEKSAFIVYPNVLFADVGALRGYNHIFLVEEPLFFGGNSAVPGRRFNIGKMKLAYMRASMKSYGALLSHQKFRVSYIDYCDVGDYEWLSMFSRIGTYEVIDFELLEKLRGIPHLDCLRFVETLLFPLPLSEIGSFFNEGERVVPSPRKAPRRYVHTHFYKWAKSKLGLLEDVKSFDTENRQPLPRGHKLQHHTPRFNDRTHSALIEEASRYVNEHPAFRKNIGDFNQLDIYPLDHAGAKKLFLDFLGNRLENFGPYQDAIDKDEPILYHSFCSTVLNNGLLSSSWVIEQIRKIRKRLPLNSLEAYVRQLCWRMWEVGIYLCFYEELRSSNHFHSKRKLKWEKWRGGRALGLEPLDNEIQKAVNFGYAAHIPRLMVFLNVFVLLQVRPEDVIRWFMEVVSMDATIYFMWAIVTTMGAYNLRFMQKPYISTSAYLLKMTNYPKGDWCDTFTALFYDFLARNKSRLKGSCSVYLRNLAHFERQTHTEQARIKRLAQSFQKRVTSR